jgi:hypothetical protein
VERRSGTLESGRVMGSRRHRAVVAALLLLVGVLAAPVVAPASEPAPEPSRISVSFTPSGAVGWCSWPFAMTYTTIQTPTTFTLRVFVPTQLCEPINPTAAVYLMPGNGAQWPQQLQETKNFQLSEAGFTDITFRKDCEPSQFDVVVGATPQAIAPWGEWHGPLLFPLDTNTAHQDGGSNCPVTTTTSTSTSTTTTTSTSTSTTVSTSTTTTTVPTTTTTTTTVPDTGTNGCTPGYWKQPQHAGSWVGFTPNERYDTVFGVNSGFPSTTSLLDALGMYGGGAKALARHATAALLNSANPAAQYRYTTAQVITLVQMSYATGDFWMAKTLFERENERGCLLGRALAG